MLNTKQINALGNILNSTAGRGSGGHVAIATSLQEDVLTLKYSTIVHFASERSLQDQLVLLVDESMQRLTNEITRMKSDFKNATGDTLKIKEESNKDNVELISATSNSPRKIAYYRRFIDLKVDVSGPAQ
jgi:hypothetical protein|tara:strand:- start:1518 stop:1907 length:390 start_codon:yes stop_codon:yes gene_type:complete